MDNNKSLHDKTVLIIGNQRYHDIMKRTSSTIKNYVQKRLHTSSSSKWADTLEYIRKLNRTGCLEIVFLDLSSDLVLLSTLDEYANLWEEIFFEIKQNKCMVFIEKHFYENLKTNGHIFYQSSYYLRNYLEKKYIHNDLKDDSFDTYVKFGDSKRTSMIQIVERVIQSGIDYSYYLVGDGMFNKIIEILDTIEPEFFFRIYIPNGHYKEGLITSFLKLFEDYMRNIAKSSFMVDQIRSEHGTIYIFKSSEKISQEMLENSIAQFNSFLNLTQNDIQKARDILINADIGTREAENIITKYVRDYNRMVIDVRQQFEERNLALKHRLENEVFDSQIIIKPNTPLKNVDLFHAENPDIININIYNQPFIDNSFIQTNYDDVYYGDINYSSEDKYILELINKFSKGLEAISLTSEYNILKDKSIPPEKKQTSLSKIGKFFVNKVVPVLGEAAKDLAIEFIKRNYLP